MRLTPLATAAVLLASTASLAAGLGRRAEWTGMIMGLGTSKIHGTATMRPGKEAGTTEVTLSTTGDEAGKTRPWHVHIGNCANATGVLGGPKLYTPVVSDAKGASKTTVTIAVPMPESGTFSINFHESPTTMATYVACGDFKMGK